MEFFLVKIYFLECQKIRDTFGAMDFFQNFFNPFDLTPVVKK